MEGRICFCFVRVVVFYLFMVFRDLEYYFEEVINLLFIWRIVGREICYL